MGRVNKMNKVKNSHVTINNEIIKNFFVSVSNRNLWSINLMNLRKSDKTSTKKFTIKHFYSSEIEEFLCENFESKMGCVISKLKKNWQIKLDENDEKIIKDFLIQLLNRNIDVIKGINESLGFEDYFSSLTPLIIENKIERNYFKDYKISIFFNNTDLSFISSTYGLGFAWPDGTIYENSFIIPISPKIIIQIYKNYDWLEINKLKQINIDNICAIKYLNSCIASFAYSMYKNSNSKEFDIFYLFSNQENEIERIKNLIENREQNCYKALMHNF